MTSQTLLRFGYRKSDPSSVSTQPAVDAKRQPNRSIRAAEISHGTYVRACPPTNWPDMGGDVPMTWMAPSRAVSESGIGDIIDPTRTGQSRCRLGPPGLGESRAGTSFVRQSID